jgi:hypothetical protein
MAVPADTVGLAIAIVNGVVKLGFRLDRLLAEKTAGDADEESNAAALEAAAAGVAPFPSEDIDADGARAKTPEAVERLSNWIAAHRDRPRTVNPLRLRLAYLLLQRGERNSAQVVYDDITDKTTLGSELQQVLYDIWNAFSWWWEAKDKTLFSPADASAAGVLQPAAHGGYAGQSYPPTSGRCYTSLPPIFA